MKLRADLWEAGGDRRFIFLRCYCMMSGNMAEAVGAGRFADGVWVTALMHRFAHYYFEALEAYDARPEHAPPAWRQVFDAAREPGTHVLQNLLLGVNAHINYDLPLALYDTLNDTWPNLGEQARQHRHNDHVEVNRIIESTIDAVQDQVVEPMSPAMAVVDRLMGRMDEWLLSQLISGWRTDVWHVAQHLLGAPDEGSREKVRKEQEQRVLERGESLLKAF